MKRFVIGGMIAAAMVATNIGAQVVQKRQEAQQDRIAQGAASGQLTARETARLERREAHLNRTIRQDRRTGGHLTVKERRRINRRQNQLSKDIARQKHDAQKR